MPNHWRIDVDPTVIIPGELSVAGEDRIDWRALGVRIKLLFPNYEGVFAPPPAPEAGMKPSFTFVRTENPGELEFIVEPDMMLPLTIRPAVVAQNYEYYVLHGIGGREEWIYIQTSSGVDPILIIGD